MDTDEQLSPLERRALSAALSKVKNDSIRSALVRQLDALKVKARTEKTFGYYADFEVSDELRVQGLSDDFNRTPPSVDARHPDGQNAIVIIVYLKSGALDFMEASATAEWPSNEDQIQILDR